jgi:hypothetical protein
MSAADGAYAGFARHGRRPGRATRTRTGESCHILALEVRFVPRLCGDVDCGVVAVTEDPLARIALGDAYAVRGGRAGLVVVRGLNGAAGGARHQETSGNHAETDEDETRVGHGSPQLKDRERAILGKDSLPLMTAALYRWCRRRKSFRSARRVEGVSIRGEFLHEDRGVEKVCRPATAPRRYRTSCESTQKLTTIN